MRIKYFPGANTSKGFISNFTSIVPPWEKDSFTYILKGGPGVGKNTLMKKLAAYASASGYNVEEFRCASDPDSFDGIRIIEKNIVVLDGTKPHIIDPECPGISDIIVDLGFFKDTDILKSKKERLLRLLRENKAHYNFAYSYLNTAYELKKEAVKSIENIIDYDCVYDTLISIFSKINENGSETRFLYSKTFTPLGIIDFEERIVKDVRTYKFSGLSGYYVMAVAYKLLENVRKTVFFDSLFTDTPNLILIKDDPVALSWDIEGKEPNEMLKSYLMDECRTNLNYASELEKKAASELNKSKEIHDEIEKLYRSHVDFEKVNKRCEELLIETGF